MTASDKVTWAARRGAPGDAEEIVMSLEGNPEVGAGEAREAFDGRFEDAWFSQAQAVPRSMSSRPPRAPSSPPPSLLDSLGDDTADGWFSGE